MTNNTSRWDEVRQTLPVGSRLSVTVKRHAPFGVFVDIPGIPFAGLVKIHELKDEGHVSPTDFPLVGAVIEAVVLGFQETDEQIWLSAKPSKLR